MLQIVLRSYLLAIVCLIHGFGTLVDCYGEQEPKKTIVFIAGNPSHGYGSHEHYAGCRRIASVIESRGFNVDCEIVQHGWPQDDSILDQADAIVIYSDGGGGHPSLPHLDRLNKLMEKGVGLVCLHYAVEVPKEDGGPKFKKWLGGYFELDWSVNPHWTAEFKELPSHPITTGVKPFFANDEWYFHIRFNEDASRITPILTAIAPESTMARPDGGHSGNPHARKAVANQVPQHLAWAFERENGGRSFGYTGGHFHWNWGRPDITQLVSNAIVWTAGIDPTTQSKPAESLPVTELAEGQDDPKPFDFNAGKIAEQFGIPMAFAGTKSDIESEQTVAPKSMASNKPAYLSPVITSATPQHQADIRVDLAGAKRIFLVVTDGGDGFSCDWANWINPVLIDSTGKELKLNELKWARASSQWGQVSVNTNVNGEPLKVFGTTYEKGIGTHANSVIEYVLPAGVRTFVAKVGLDAGGVSQQDGKTTSVQFAVYLDRLPDGTAQGRTDISEEREPENAVAGLDAHPGVAVQLAASEPTLKSLTNIDIDHKGRVWACEVVNYRGHRNDRPEGDRILILQDDDQDGVMDSSKVFYQGRDIDSALGICVLGNRVLVSAAPYVIEFVDKNGDDIPDEKNYVFTNSGEAQHDHSVHSFTSGPDNKLYFNFGNTGHQLCDRNGNPIKDRWGREINDSGNPYRQGMVFRCNQDFSDMEVLGHNFRNNYELAVDSFGSLWQSDNDDDGNRATRINFVMEYGNYGYTDEKSGDSWQQYRSNMEAEIPHRHWHLNDPGVVPTILITGAGSPTGITVYEGNLLPKEFQNQVIHCDAGPNMVRAYPTNQDGAGYSASILELVSGARDKWFRPADICVAPDGSLFISDWYDPGVGGHQMVDMERGRLFRVAPENSKYVVPNYDLASIDGAVDALSNPNQSVRFMAMQALEGFGLKAERQLVELSKSSDSRKAARAIWMLSKLDSVAAKHIQSAIKSPDVDLRITAIRAARSSKLDRSIYIDPLLMDVSPQVRRELCIALREDDSADMPRRWVELARQYDGADRWMLEALGIAAMDRWDDCIEALKQSPGFAPNAPAMRNIIWRSRSNMTADLIVEMLLDTNATADSIDTMFRSLDFQESSKSQQALNRLLQVAASNQTQSSPDSQSFTDRIVTEAAMRVRNARKLLQDVNISDSITRYVSSLGMDLKVLEIAERLPVDGIVNSLLSMANEFVVSNEGVQAIELALQNNASQIIESQLIAVSEQSDALERGKALQLTRLLALSNRKDATSLLQKLLEDASVDSSLRIAAAAGLARKIEGQAYLISLAESHRLPPVAATSVASALRASRDPSIAGQAVKLFSLVASSGRELPPIEELARVGGDAGRGKKLFESVATCSQCHIVGGTGKNVGPDLSEIGDKLTREAMLVAIINPSAGISHNYESYSVLTDDDQVVTGLLVSKNDNDVVLKDKDGIVRKFMLADIELKKLEVSLMPNNLQDLLDQQGLVDIVEYMTTLKK